jgi:hypothetical protein
VEEQVSATVRLQVSAREVPGSNPVRDTSYTNCDVTREIFLAVNTEKTKYMLLSRHQNAGQNRDKKIGNRCFENVTQFRCLGTTKTNQTLVQVEIKRRLNSGNICYNSVQNILSSRLLCKNVKIGIFFVPCYNFACSLEWV